jgi:hypothetical protein
MLPVDVSMKWYPMAYPNAKQLKTYSLITIIRRKIMHSTDQSERPITKARPKVVWYSIWWGQGRVKENEKKNETTIITITTTSIVSDIQMEWRMSTRG